MEQLAADLRAPLSEFLLSVADDKFMLGHRNADWTGLAPILEEDIAFSSIAQDEIAHASALYELVAGLLNSTANQIAFGRKPSAYRCARIVELSDVFNWATAIVRNFFCDHFDAVRLARMARSGYVPLAQLSSRLAAEERVHVEHVDSWIRRLGQGGNDARARVQAALDALSAAAVELWETTDGTDALTAAGVLPKSNGDFARWTEALQTVAGDAGLKLQQSPLSSGFLGGRHGKHDQNFAALLDELTEVFRLEPEAAW